MNPVPPVEVGQPAPPLTLMDPATGEPVELQDYEGRAVLLTLWATWCGPCRSELVAIEAVHREFAAQGLTVDPIGRVFGSLVSKYNVSHDSGRGGPGASLEN